MEFRKTAEADINAVMNIIRQAQSYFKENGINQWQNNYPNFDVIMSDIKKGGSFVLIEDDKIIGTAAVYFDGEKNYDSIYDGKWITNDDYAVIHRIAVDYNLKGKGIASLIIKNVEDMCIKKSVHSIKVDTHEDNVSMQRLLKKNEFKYCGVIYLEDKSKRLAFEKNI